MVYNDKIGDRNLQDKRAIEKSMSQRRLVFRDSMEADLMETER